MKKYAEIDYDFRPATYAVDPTPRAAILRNIKGENRRQMIAFFYENGRMTHLNDEILRPTLTPAGRAHFAWMHPACLGGEGLPDYWPDEVEIARLALQDNAASVISLRALETAGKITYRAVDETGQPFSLPITESSQPLTLAELIAQFDQGNVGEGFLDGGLSLGFNRLNPEELAPDDLVDFTVISSEFYPDLEHHYYEAFDDYVADLFGDEEGEDDQNETA